MSREVVTDGTNGYVLNENGIQVYTLADGTNRGTLAPTTRFKSIAFGNSKLFGAAGSSIYDINLSSGALTKLGTVEDVIDITYKDTDELTVLAGASLVDFNVGTGAIIYVNKDMN